VRTGGRRRQAFVLLAILWSSAAAAARQPGPPDVPWPQDSAAKPGSRKILVNQLQLGSMTIGLETTRLDELTRLIPGTRIHARGDASESLAWVCFRVVTQYGLFNVWPNSGELGGGRIIDGVVVAPVAHHPEPDCPVLAVNGGPIGFDNGVWIGMARSAAYAKLGTPTRKFGSVVAFDSERPAAGREKDCTTGGDLVLDIQSGRIARIWATKVTSC